MTFEGEAREPIAAFHVADSADGVQSLVPTGGFLPSRLVWRGLVLNSIIHCMFLLGGLWAVGWGSKRVRAGLGAALRHTAAARARRGACRACGHPLAGLACCPECGAVAK